MNALARRPDPSSQKIEFMRGPADGKVATFASDNVPHSWRERTPHGEAEYRLVVGADKTYFSYYAMYYD